MTNCVLMWGLGSTSDCGHTPRTKATLIQYVPYFLFTVLYILHVQYTMKGWFTLSHLPEQEEVFNKAKNYSQLYSSWVHSVVRGYVLLFCETQTSQFKTIKLLIDSNFCYRERDYHAADCLTFSCNYSPWGNSPSDECSRSQASYFVVYYHLYIQKCQQIAL
jgi:hypothetical protein